MKLSIALAIICLTSCAIQKDLHTWDKRELTFAFSTTRHLGTVPINSDMIKDAFRLAALHISDKTVLNITEYTGTNPRKADIIVSFGRLPKNTLGFAYPPHSVWSGNIELNKEYDWSSSMARKTSLHELGHAIGLDHVMSKESIMNRRIRLSKLQYWDIIRINRMYKAIR